MSQIIDGKLVSKQVRQRVAKETEELKAKGITPGLAVIIVGEDPASQVYVKKKLAMKLVFTVKNMLCLKIQLRRS